jgi:hypothetical protein
MPDPHTPVHRFVAGSHMLLGGVLLSQKRYLARACTEDDLVTLGPYSRLLAHLDDCVTEGEFTAEDLGVDPVFEPDSTIYDPHVVLEYWCVGACARACACVRACRVFVHVCCSFWLGRQNTKRRLLTRAMLSCFCCCCCCC